MKGLTQTIHPRDARAKMNMRWLVVLCCGAAVGHVCAIGIAEFAPRPSAYIGLRVIAIALAASD